ncbi:hypothetical protein AB4Y38_42090 [Paraburkholderia sp. EG285A]|uniref:hypothetical protein n=1 Tax=Paraburkholderia sp. EG285A TaxID=3237009 RepID=UPI0034D370BB
MKKLKRVLGGALMVAALVGAAVLAAASDKECTWQDAENPLESFTLHWWPGGGEEFTRRSEWTDY